MNNELIRILLVDDDEDDYTMTRDMLFDAKNLEHKLHWISSYDEALKAVIEGNYDVYLFDYRLGEHTGLDLLDNAVRHGCRSPIILLTGQGDHEVDIKAMKAGASDYLVKTDINTPLLERSIRYALERKRNEKRISHMAFYDCLTDLPNRSLFRDRLKQAIALSERKQNLLAVLFLDIDNFKRVNDTFGHHLGDDLLRAVADRLRGIIRNSDSLTRQSTEDLFARLGGDEFTVLLCDVKEVDDAARVAQRIIETLSRPFMLDNHEVFVTSSIGITIYPHDGKDDDSLLRNADAAMYYAKETGRNRYHYYRQAMNASALKKLILENDLRRAIEGGELLLYYQPQIDIETGKIIGMEALIRWQHPQQGLVPPSEFIPLAEETGLINPLSDWVLKTACMQNRDWRREGLPRIPVSVNLTSQQFQQKDFVRTLGEVLEESDSAPQDLILEITESTLMKNTDIAYTTIQELNRMGLRLTIDDFGTGYSSLSYLKRFPIYAIKIDRAFTEEISDDPEDAAIARAIISMAKNLKMEVIAEGVETERQLAYLHEHGCAKIQGYLFSRPLPVDEAIKILSREKTGEGIGQQILSKIFRAAIGT